jgi:hypothetical protein
MVLLPDVRTGAADVGGSQNRQEADENRNLHVDGVARAVTWMLFLAVSTRRPGQHVCLNKGCPLGLPSTIKGLLRHWPMPRE